MTGSSISARVIGQRKHSGTVRGVGCCSDSVALAIVKTKLENKNITIFGDGTQTRSFCYVDDLIKGLISMMETNKSVTGPINLGNPNEFTMNQLAREVIRITNSKSKIAYKELPQDDPRKRQPDITLAKSELNWEPTIELEEGLKKTIDYFKTN